ncbi:hypothetical protein K437DRAFT_267873 [Tilletiaria anomala UBC 951]|uniref:Tcp11-domain-containing protein n=1 Tax=Tilletiaria anomala (strain ATCC 24038 / CBS 436.72 / UBC 951) TaxID=1037660 RepID=A0A066W9B5_TILAU|nr:uncharacterized protein K437DRAFT_267873 [Tilletiaria anomala UBC 951]KDN47330.1 hypothetical protein K437DRAFT_267873 [Tilletiaria anomala UBC 951]
MESQSSTHHDQEEASTATSPPTAAITRKRQFSLIDSPSRTDAEASLRKRITQSRSRSRSPSASLTTSEFDVRLQDMQGCSASTPPSPAATSLVAAHKLVTHTSVTVSIEGCCQESSPTPRLSHGRSGNDNGVLYAEYSRAAAARMPRSVSLPPRLSHSSRHSPALDSTPKGATTIAANGVRSEMMHGVKLATSYSAPVTAGMKRTLHYHEQQRRLQKGKGRAPGVREQARGRGQYVYPIQLPPVSTKSVEGLDLKMALQLPQTRHHIIFDHNLAFNLTPHGERGQAWETASERYWAAVRREIELGCVCSVYQDGVLLPCTCPAAPSAKQSGTSQPPPRLPLLLAQLRELCVQAILHHQTSDLLRPISRSRAGSSVGKSFPSAMQTGRTSPLDILSSHAGTYADPHAHAITDMFDLDLSVFSSEDDDMTSTLGSAAISRRFESVLRVLQLHCVPEREEDIVDVLEDGIWEHDIVEGLRVLFELLELMRLDTTNVYVSRNAPFLREVAAARERVYFTDQIISGRFPITRTISWHSRSLAKVEGSCASAPLALQHTLTRTFIAGLVELIVQSLQDGAIRPTGAPTLLHVHASRRVLPEVFLHDQVRLLGFCEELTDIAIVHVLLLLFRHLASTGDLCNGTASRIDERELSARIHSRQNQLKLLCLETLQRANRQHATDCHSGRAPLPKMADATWRHEVQGLALTMSREAVLLRKEVVEGGLPKAPVELSAAMESLIRSWVHHNVGNTSHLLRMCVQKVQDCVVAALDAPVSMYVAQHFTQASGLDFNASPITTAPGFTGEPKACSNNFSVSALCKRDKVEDHAHADTCIARHLYLDTVTPLQLLQLPADWHAGLARAALTALAPQVEHFAASLARFALLHLEVYGVLYAFLARRDAHLFGSA